MLLLSETHLTDKILNREININNYDILRSDSSSRHTGGVAIYIKKKIKYKLISNKQINKNVWILSIELNEQKRNLNGQYTVLYHSPSSSDAVFIKYFNEWIEKNHKEEKKHVICGDFNIDMSDTSNKICYKNKLNSTINENGMRQIMNENTRITRKTSTLIDLIITNTNTIKCKIEDNDKISDHSTIHIISNNKINKKEHIEKRMILHNYTKENFKNELRNKFWSFILDENLSVSKKAEKFTENLTQSINVFKKEILIRNKENNKWYDKNLRKLKKERDEAYKQTKGTKNGDLWITYKKLRNKYSKMIKSTSNDYTKRSIKECEGDSKAMWRRIKEITNEKQSEVDRIELNGNEICDEKEIAETLNNYFIESINDLNTNIKQMPPPRIKKNEKKRTHEKFKFRNIEEKDIERVLKQIKTKSDPEMINKNILLDAMPVIGNIFVKIINESFKKGEFPDSWKMSTVKPIFKAKNSKNVKNIRPVNMLPTYEKVIEKLADEQLQEYLDKHKLINENQSGYRKAHSCETAINLVIQKWKEAIDKNKTILCIFIDLSRAFETIEREKLIERLREIGVGKNAIKWYRSYLTNRTQTTVINNEKSNVKLNNLGVPQGSVSGAKLFNIYINSVEKTIEHSNMKMFADDTMMYLIVDDIKKAEEQMNEDLNNFEKWLSEMKLKANIEKTKFMIINEKKNENINLKMNDEEIKRVKSMKYLGVMIDDKLEFKEHFDYIYKKMAKKVGFLGRISRKLAIETKIIIYKTIIAPHLDYCSTILYLMNDEQMNKLQKIQNRAMRIILRMNRYTSRKFMLETLQWQSVRQRLTFNALIMIHKINNNLTPNYLKENIQRVCETSTHETRNKNELRLPKYKKAKTQNNIFYKGVKQYMELNTLLRNEKRMHIFKNKLNKWIKEEINL